MGCFDQRAFKKITEKIKTLDWIREIPGFERKSSVFTIKVLP